MSGQIYSATNAHRTKRIKQKAQDWGEYIKQKQYLKIEYPPRLVRLVSIQYRYQGSSYTTGWFHQLSQVRDSLQKSVEVTRVLRAWRAHVAGESTNIWNSILYAKAERDAYNWHYALYLMVRGTKAEEL